MQKEYYSVQDLSELIGLSKSSIYKLTGNREISFYKPFGKKIFFSKEQVEKILKEKIKTRAEIEESIFKKGDLNGT